MGCMVDLRISNRQDSETDTNGSKHSELPLTCPFNALVEIAFGGGKRSMFLNR
jgi:hypothetical protein